MQKTLNTLEGKNGFVYYFTPSEGAEAVAASLLAANDDHCERTTECERPTAGLRG